MRRELRPADAELARLDRADGGARPECDLDRAVELRPEVDPAGVAVDAGVELPQRRGGRGRASAGWAEELPAQLGKTGARRVQQELERLAAVRLPRVRQLVRAQLLAAALEHVDKGIDEARVETLPAEPLGAAPRPR